ncbi:MAG: DUF4383 domain-containing protein [Actinomycetota bacterium]
MSINKLFARAFGAIYIIIGAVGFSITNHVAFSGPHGRKLLGLFEVNPLHNIVHILIGAALVAASFGTVKAARGMNLTIGVAYFATFLLGLAMVGKSWDFLALNQADNLLHIATATVALVVALRTDRDVATSPGRVGRTA